MHWELSADNACWGRNSLVISTFHHVVWSDLVVFECPFSYVMFQFGGGAGGNPPYPALFENPPPFSNAFLSHRKHNTKHTSEGKQHNIATFTTTTYYSSAFIYLLGGRRFHSSRSEIKDLSNQYNTRPKQEQGWHPPDPDTISPRRLSPPTVGSSRSSTPPRPSRMPVRPSDCDAPTAWYCASRSHCRIGCSSRGRRDGGFTPSTSTPGWRSRVSWGTGGRS